jgi:putative transposase
VSLRQVLNAILYSLKTGCQWRQLPREFPAWTAVYYYFRTWSYDGTWARLHHLLHAKVR